ncbi:hypothetical protein FRACYDRAFT_184644 [Fragilariopsis cylindrus CCMP1102]|uniref:Inositol hexakisphosphate and diphosphoinositol-pentakisphosphate kinase n=1 Tax=Fragilariopsis cylindrus CCMP1102 TaxID=635003 RepID=A0A1E7FJ67_9STRA|nr:hypothetical protein FRACYDRAFT_184644 [Fragilariopsis cylindrus CCMP1102]|eukprot:OEU18075.1 hypothetical protein FRACYDRAFT_184644 [Fragilariopsis cylindrus CCMP1102]
MTPTTTLKSDASSSGTVSTLGGSSSVAVKRSSFKKDKKPKKESNPFIPAAIDYADSLGAGLGTAGGSVEGGEHHIDGRIQLGICAMDKKARSKPMAEILSRLDETLFRVVFFGDDLILNHPIDDWPSNIDVLIAFYSKGYPLTKAKEYVKLRNVYLLNDLNMQSKLQDRRKVYDMLEASGIDVPRHVFLSLDNYKSTGTHVEEYDDHIEINGVSIHKPFVEKPIDADDHNIAIYYPTSAGGGCKKLFRKIGNRSSEFYPDISEIRRDGSYVYEEFVETQGTDVKMYTVGPDYGHAEARKSPTVDGKVQRNADGKELRFPVILTRSEKEIARRIVVQFKQFVCGFDLLRVQEGHSVVSYCCDVNGFSFVKNSRKYYDDCAQILTEHMLAVMKPGQLLGFSTLDPLLTEVDNVDLTEHSVSSLNPLHHVARMLRQEELRCVIAVVRHGDRTPKEKLKMNTKEPIILQYFIDNSVDKMENSTKDLKVKAKGPMVDFLAAVQSATSSSADGKDDDDTSENNKLLWKFKHMRDILERWKISGLTRKLQIKPRKFDTDPDTGEKLRCKEVQLILKWGGDLTKLGENQAIKLGKQFRQEIYPDAPGGGILRLHSTFRHDLKIKTSDEGRVMKTAAAFAKGLLELEGEIPPILVSLVHKEKGSMHMLDPSGDKDVKLELDECKEKLSKNLQQDIDWRAMTEEDRFRLVGPPQVTSLRDALAKIGNPRKTLQMIYETMGTLIEELEVMLMGCGSSDEKAAVEPGGIPKGDSEEDGGNDAALSGVKLYKGETLLELTERWRFIHKRLYDKETDTFDLTRIPDVLDNVRFDVLHNPHLGFNCNIA